MFKNKYLLFRINALFGYIFLHTNAVKVQAVEYLVTLLILLLSWVFSKSMIEISF